MEIRAAVAGDAVEINDIYNHYVRTSHATFDVEPMDPAWRSRWLLERRGGRHRVFVAETADGLAGFTSSGPYKDRAAYAPTVETSVYLAPGYAGRGIGSALYRRLVHALHGEDVHRCVAAIAQPNLASVRLHQATGFRRVGTFTEQGRKFGRFWDVDWYELPLERDD